MTVRQLRLELEPRHYDFMQVDLPGDQPSFTVATAIDGRITEPGFHAIDGLAMPINSSRAIEAIGKFLDTQPDIDVSLPEDTTELDIHSIPVEECYLLMKYVNNWKSYFDRKVMLRLNDIRTPNGEKPRPRDSAHYSLKDVASNS